MMEPTIEKACNAEIIFTQDEINRRIYEKREKFKRDRIAELNYAVNRAVERAVKRTEKRTAKRTEEKTIKREREKYLELEENRVINWCREGKSLEDILYFSSLPPERVKQLFAENHP